MKTILYASIQEELIIVGNLKTTMNKCDDLIEFYQHELTGQPTEEDTGSLYRDLSGDIEIWQVMEVIE